MVKRMKLKAKLKITADVLMTLLLLFVMGYQLWGEVLHEWAGAGMFLLFLLHHVLNSSWHKNIFKNKYTPMRTAQTLSDVLLLADMLILVYSGIVMSRHVFAFLPIEAGMMLARRLHILGSYWGFVLMSLHLGLHWGIFLGMGRKAAGIQTKSKRREVLLFLVSAGIAIYGAVVFIRRDFITYMLLKTEFVFLDYEESPILFYIDYLALMGFFIFIAHYFARGVRTVSMGKKKNTVR